MAALILAIAALAPVWAQPTGSPYAPQRPSPGQSPATPLPAPKKASAKDLAEIRTLIDAGKTKEALEAVAALEAVPDVCRLGVEAALGAEVLPQAIGYYETLVATLGKEEPEALRQIAISVARGSLASPDGFLAVEACETLLEHGDHPCAARLRQQGADGAQPLPLRLAALAVLARAGKDEAGRQFLALAASAAGGQQRAAVENARALPAAVAVPVLSSALANADGGVRYSAASALGSYSTPEARTALEKFLATDPDPLSRGAARLSLAKLGDERWLKEFVAVLPQLDGDVLLELGELLQARGDPRGVAAMAKVAQGTHEVLRVTAAAQLPADYRELATAVLTEALDGENPWTRAIALQHFRRADLLTLARARRYLADAEPLVQLRAAQAVLGHLSQPATSAGAKKP